MNTIIDIRHGAVLLACFLGCAQLPPAADFESGDWKADLEGTDGRPVYEFRAKQGVVRVKDGAGGLLAFLRTGPNGVEIDDGTGRVVAVVLKPSERRRALRVVGAGGRETLFELRTEADGDFKITDPDDVVLYKVKLRDYGFKVIDRSGVALSKVRVREEKVSVRAPEGGTYLSTRDALPSEAVAVMSLEGIPVEVRAGLAVAITRGMPPTHGR